ncbi:uncharacterized protein LOC143206972 isoform X2 [Rhynchophorus ferrugineus]|uniref:uncharacterized protein LOC143206972 isoform X2 n=2 Tax=Rhynchophorus ferrugineus TaxID=354439 RepID=UPI003FCE295B
MFSNKARSQKNVKFKKLEEVTLPNAKLKFCADQLQNLNLMFQKRLEQDVPVDAPTEKSLNLARSVTERLIQRLFCGVGQIDSRFTSKFLIENHFSSNQHNSTHLEYIVRLDALSHPTLYNSDDLPSYEILENNQDCPAGYAKIRLTSSTLQAWKEFTNSNGYLRRDRIQAKMVELLAQAAVQEKPNSPLQVDESVMCGIPGKIVDPFTLYHILKIPANEQVFYGPSGNVPRFPDTRDFRLAIVDEPHGIKIKVEFLSPALSSISIKVMILIAIDVDMWPSSTDFPARVPLGHLDCLLYHQAAQSGMYLVGYGVHSAAWQIRLAAAEYYLFNHYGAKSTVRTVLDILYEILIDINTRRKYQKPISYKILNKYMLFTILLEDLEENSTTPFIDMLYWSPMYLSTIVLRLLDKTILRLQSEIQSNYFFKNANLLVNPGHLCDDDFNIEAGNVKNYMVRLFDESLVADKDNEDLISLLVSQETEVKLLYRWKSLVDGLLPPPGTRSKRLFFAGSRNRREIAHTQYTARQLEYIGMVLQSMLKVQQRVIKPYQNISTESVKHEDKNDETSPLEDIIFILVTILEQARDQYLINETNPTISKNQQKIRTSYDACVSKLIEIIRCDKELLLMNNIDLEDDLTLVKIILKWLYKAMDHNKKYLGLILRPFLSTIFLTSHHISYHLELIKERLRNDEIESLGLFSKLVNTGSITPAQGLVDSVNKNWIWAKDMLGMVEQNTLRLFFIEERGKVYRHILSLPSDSSRNADEVGASRTWTDKEKKRRAVRRRTTLPARNYFSSLLYDHLKDGRSEIPQHDVLKMNSPLTAIINKKLRRGQHRGSGDIFRCMESMQKLNVFKEAASALPKEDQNEILDIIQNIHMNKVKKSLNKRWSSTLPHSSKIVPQDHQPIQRYTPKEESAGLQLSPKEKRRTRGILRGDSLLGTTRAARLREDNAIFLLQENFRLKCLVHKADFFRI